MPKKANSKRHIKYTEDSHFQKEQFQRKKTSKRTFKNKKRRPDIETNIIELNSQHKANPYPKEKRPLQAQTDSQQRYINAINTHCLTFGMGAAGTGKSYCAGALAAQALEAGHIEKIIITRPAVETGEQLGFLPGQLEDKFAVYLDAFKDILIDRLGEGVVEYCLRHNRIVGAPLAYMRGKTFNSSTFVILDEAQNTTPSQMKMFLTRIGEDCKIVVNGDINQSDIRGSNGLADAIERLKGLPSVHIHHFEKEDCVRSGLVKELLDRYENESVSKN